MIIDNIFSIKTYTGSQPLPLFNAPASLASNATYTTFLNNISTIYGTQTSDGVVPTFSKIGSTPDPKSSLRSLDPQQAYYFISKADVVLPYNIPFSGTILPSPYRNCPTVDLLPTRASLTSASGNYYYLINDVGNLNIAYPYTYEVKVLSSNWKITTLTPSGTVASSQPTNAIIAAIRFDSDYGVSDYPSFLPNNTSLTQVDKNNLFAIVEVSLVPPPDTGCSKIIDLMLLQCNNCIPAPTPLPTPSPTVTITPTMTPTPTRTPPASFDTTLTVSVGTANLQGVSMAAGQGDKIEFAAKPAGTARAALLFIPGGTQVAQITYTDTYIGSPFRFTRFSTGVSYNGVFADLAGGTINLTPA